MSDNLNAYNFNKYLSHLRCELNNLEQEKNKKVAFQIFITNQCLKNWHDHKTNIANVRYTEILNAFLIKNYGLLVREDSDELEERIRKKTSKAKSGL